MADLPLHDQSNDHSDFEDADRGLVARLTPAVVTAADGRVVWDNDAYAFLEEERPGSVDPGLWRQGRLCARQGLYEVTDGVYQVRGLDLSNMTIVEGDTGVVVIDPLISVECAEAALGLYREHRGGRPVTGVIYTHAHVDHFGGVRGVTGGGVPILAPAGFMEHAVAEHVYAGPAITRRSVYMYGQTLERSPSGQVGAGLGMATSTGTVSLLPPTLSVIRTGQEEVVDGVRIVFQLTPGAEAPAEMNILFPDHRALCLAENATHNQHTLLPLRGSAVRDARAWSRHLTEAISLFGGRADVAFASHHWPTWGADAVVRFLSQQRDLYAYLHDQTVRLMNKGLTGPEIAETLRMPPRLERAWHARGFHGSLSHNVKAVYQRYLGWFDGNPAHLWEHPPRESAIRYVDCMGGGAAVVTLAKGYIGDGDLRFAAQLLNHAVFADEGNKQARDLLAEVYTRLGYGAENGTWRNVYLTGARELADGIVPAVTATACPDLAQALGVDQIFDSIAIRVHGPRAWNESLSIDWHLTDLGERYRTTLSNGAFVHQIDPPDEPVDLTLSLTKAQLIGLLAGRGVEGVEREGSVAVLQRLVSVLDEPRPDFPIVTP
ncbi:alkyl sulfatase BDS1-like metallo-beta-lactamase superfamily hydrolase [Nonomuraea muscovyensis]|uniref:Alkyl sulfatase BDS1-like metallo-beta-lactamase superfamily hydrolase n=1 Tax=Nonomuraea muscovyensis TaxID=1124761 RepID=A0A7X0CB79_9ACTN|nr:alkyl sulfatase dimerization domain-containing protein [Nonomuraea muscovyensis]MBB6350129.1 alkyl sulfatase BDS1-like metallo-beta-lactamase superfamily hydrolase [Nonomuraea muscovyensis]